MDIKTCEEYVLAELKQAQLEARYWHKRASILAQKLAIYEAAAKLRKGPRPTPESPPPTD